MTILFINFVPQMNKRFIITLSLIVSMTFFCVQITVAQKKELSEAQSIIKKGKEFDKAEKILVGLLKNEANKSNIRIYNLWFDAVKGQYDAQNKKLYVGQAADTTALMNTCQRMHDIVLQLDSLDRKEAQKYKSTLAPIRSNLLGGGIYFMKKNKWAEAYRFFDMFIDTSSHPVFGGDDSFEKLSQAAYYATFTANNANDADKVLKHEVLALADTTYSTSAMQYLADAYYAKDDKLNYERILRMGFEKSTTPTYFFNKLMAMYMDESHLDKALEIVEKAVDRDSLNAQYIAMGGQLLQMMNRSDEALKWSDKAISLDEENADAYRTASVVYMQKLDYVEGLPRTKANRQSIKEISQKAKYYLECYRALREDDIDGWGSALYRIYLNLNMGEEFEEIDNLLRDRN